MFELVGEHQALASLSLAVPDQDTGTGDESTDDDDSTQV